MIDLGFLIRNVQEAMLIIQKYCHHLLSQAGLWQWTFFLETFFKSVFQSPVNIAFQGFPSPARVEELQWSEDSSDASQNLPGTVKGLQMSPSLSLPSSQLLPLGREGMPNTGHPFSWCWSSHQKPVLLQSEGSGLSGWWTLHWELGWAHWEFRAPSPAPPGAKPLCPAESGQSCCSSPHITAVRSIQHWGTKWGCPVFPLCAGAQQGRSGPCSPVNTQGKHSPAVSLGWHGVCTGTLVTNLLYRKSTNHDSNLLNSHQTTIFSPGVISWV